MSKKKKFLLFLIVVLILVPGALYIPYRLGYIINTTISYPYGIYHLNQEKKEIFKGKMVMFCPPNNKAFEEANHRYIPKISSRCENKYLPLIKKIVALPGDRVDIRYNHVYIDGKLQPNSTIYTMDFVGNKLRKLPKQSFIVPKGKLFVMSDYEKRSFDSRYFGSIDQNLIQGEISPVWTYETELKEYDAQWIKTHTPINVPQTILLD